MAEKLITRSHESKMSAEQKRNLKNHLVLPAGALALGAALTGGAIAAGNHIFHETIIGSTVEQVLPGEGPINTVDRAAHELAEKYDIDPGTISNITNAGFEVGGELIEHHPGKAIQPYESMIVTLSKNGLGQPSVSADPTNLAHLDK